MSKPNPLPTLVDHCDVKLGTIALVLPKQYSHLSTLHSLARAKALKPRTHSMLCDLTLTAWGTHPDPNIRKFLWECYFSGKRPHIWHVLFYMLEIPMATLVEKSGLSERSIRKYLPKSKVPQRHLRAIAPFAIEYRDALASKKSRAGVDPRYMILHRALTDRRRMTTAEDIDAE